MNMLEFKTWVENLKRKNGYGVLAKSDKKVLEKLFAEECARIKAEEQTTKITEENKMSLMGYGENEQVRDIDSIKAHPKEGKQVKIKDRTVMAQFNELLKRNKYTIIDMNKISRVLYTPRMFELLRSPLSEEEANQVLRMIGERFKSTYFLIEGKDYNKQTLNFLRGKIQDLLEMIGIICPYIFSEFPRVECSYPNDEQYLVCPTVDIWMKITGDLKVYTIRMSNEGIEVGNYDPYEEQAMKVYKDCKLHYSEMYNVRMGTGECPWCKLEHLQEFEREVCQHVKSWLGGSLPISHNEIWTRLKVASEELKITKGKLKEAEDKLKFLDDCCMEESNELVDLQFKLRDANSEIAQLKAEKDSFIEHHRLWHSADYTSEISNGVISQLKAEIKALSLDKAYFKAEYESEVDESYTLKRKLEIITKEHDSLRSGGIKYVKRKSQEYELLWEEIVQLQEQVENLRHELALADFVIEESRKNVSAQAQYTLPPESVKSFTTKVIDDLCEPKQGTFSDVPKLPKEWIGKNVLISVILVATSEEGLKGISIGHNMSTALSPSSTWCSDPGNVSTIKEEYPPLSTKEVNEVCKTQGNQESKTFGCHPKVTIREFD